MMSADATQSTDFALSRFYAKGWSAGTRSTAEEQVGDVAALAAARNPEAVPAQRARWVQGFTEAVARGQDRRERRKPAFAQRRHGQS